MGPNKRYILIGDGAAGLTAARAIRLADDHARIMMISDDPHPTYYRAALTNYLMGELRDEQLWAVPPTFFDGLRIERHHDRVRAVESNESRLWLSSFDRPVPYDALLIGSGARCRPPPFEAGAELGGVCVLRTLQDARFVMDTVVLDHVHHAVVIGGGPLAIEWALAMREHGVGVSMLIRGGRVMGNELDAVGSDLVLARLRHAGIDVRSNEVVARAYPGPDGRVGGVQLESGGHIACGLVGAAVGVVPNTEFLAQSGIELGKRGGVRVDAFMRTSAPDVFAAGDVAEGPWPTVQLWETARLQAAVAAANMLGGQRQYRPATHYFATRLCDLDFASVGVVSKDGAEQIVEHRLEGDRISYRKLLVEGGRLIGALMLGQRKERVRARGRELQRLVDSKIDVTRVKSKLLDPSFDLKGWLGSQALLHEPKVTMMAAALDLQAARPAGPVAHNAQIRGTQALDIGALLARAAPAAAVALPAMAVQPVRSAMLSIGLRAPAAPPPPPQELNAVLRSSSRSWPIRTRTLGIGRQPTCDVVLDDRSVSHLHAQITLHGVSIEGGNALYLRDSGSRSGTWVMPAGGRGWRPVTTPHRLESGDRIRVGDSELLFESDAGPTREGAPSVLGQGALPQGPPRLEGVDGPCLGLRFALTGAQVTLGRDVTCEVRLEDPSVSRRHALLAFAQGQWRITDLSSSRGTTHNGAMLQAGREEVLQEGDRIQLGDSTLVFTSVTDTRVASWS